MLWTAAIATAALVLSPGLRECNGILLSKE